MHRFRIEQRNCWESAPTRSDAGPIRAASQPCAPTAGSEIEGLELARLALELGDQPLDDADSVSARTAFPDRHPSDPTR